MEKMTHLSTNISEMQRSQKLVDVPKYFLSTLYEIFEQNANMQIALEQKMYMRNQFEFLGITSPKRRELQKYFLSKEFLPQKSEVEAIIKTLWQRPEREFQYFAQELAFKYCKSIEERDLAQYEYMVTHKSWWDTVDFIASKLMGGYFMCFPERREDFVRRSIASNNIWLQRSALLFQLKYKNDLDSELLSFTIQALIPSKEFFINKAIGWILREYAKTNPTWVIDFVQTTPLDNLSKREAVRSVSN